MLEDKDFELLEEAPVTEEVVEDIEINDDDFVLTQIDETVHEQKFQTKPTTFLKDSLKRFTKNKSSVVAAYILGALLLMSFVVPLVDTSNTKKPHPEETYLSPKLFDNTGVGFWDGTVNYKNIAVDISQKPDAKTEEEKQEYWWPSSKSFPQHSAISKKSFTDEKYTNDISTLGTFGKEGFVHFGYYYNRTPGDIVAFSSKAIPSLTIDGDIYLTSLDTYDVEKMRIVENKQDIEAPENYEIGESAFYFVYSERNESGVLEEKEVQLVDYAVKHNIGSAISSMSEEKVEVGNTIKTATGKDTFENAYFSLRMIAGENEKNTCSLVRSIAFETNLTNDTVNQHFVDMSFMDATSAVTKAVGDEYQYWSSTGVRRIYLSKAYFCSFVYDTYEAAYGAREIEGFSILKLLDYEKAGWMSFMGDNGFPTLYESGSSIAIDTVHFKCEILDANKCPVTKPLTIADFVYPTPGSDGIAEGTVTAKATVLYYKYLGYKTMPKFLMGTDKSGRDMFKYVFEGLRTSLLLGVLTFAVCFLFGLAWGSICGYFGGTVDLLMERFTDILAGVPWIVVMTLIIIHMGSNFWTFALALCLTGWIGTAARTRTQFYRFRGREYVLASRTLGASDARLIAKHILPNALGTIITGAVLMIPSVIFSEATISYLGLGLKNLASLGVILSDNQAELLTSSYLLIFPAIVIALIMISFNLFGNGLRDAINPSLKGEE